MEKPRLINQQLPQYKQPQIRLIKYSNSIKHTTTDIQIQKKKYKNNLQLPGENNISSTTKHNTRKLDLLLNYRYLNVRHVVQPNQKKVIRNSTSLIIEQNSTKIFNYFFSLIMCNLY